MRILKFFTNNKEKETPSGFADFFLHASEKEKKRVFTEAARRANEDQRIMVESINKPRQKTA